MAKFRIIITDLEKAASLQVITKGFSMEQTDEELEVENPLEAKAMFITIRDLLQRAGFLSGEINEQNLTQH